MYYFKTFTFVKLKGGSPVDPMDKKKTTPLHLAAEYGHPKMASLLINRKASLTLTNNEGHNALTIAIRNGNRLGSGYGC